MTRTTVRRSIIATILLVPAATAFAVAMPEAVSAANCLPASMVGSAGYAEGPSGQRVYACSQGATRTSLREQTATGQAPGGCRGRWVLAMGPDRKGRWVHHPTKGGKWHWYCRIGR